MICYDDFSKSNISKHNPNWPQALDHPYIILLVRGSGSGKTNILLNLIKRQDDDEYSIIYKISTIVCLHVRTKILVCIKKKKKKTEYITFTQIYFY